MGRGLSTVARIYQTITKWEHRYTWYILKIYCKSDNWAFGPDQEIIHHLDYLVEHPPFDNFNGVYSIYRWIPENLVESLIEKFDRISRIEIVDSRNRHGTKVII